MKRVTVVHPKYNKLHGDMMVVFKMHASEFTAQELLAVASQVVGQLMALQDASKPNSLERSLECIRVNIELGNQTAIEQAMTLETKGSA